MLTECKPGLAVRTMLRPGMCFAALILALPLAAPTWAAPAPKAQIVSRAVPQGLAAQIASEAGSLVRPFYRARNYRPIWIDPASGRLHPAAHSLARLLQTSAADGIKPSKLGARNVSRALYKASNGDTKALAKAEVRLSETFVRYVQLMRRDPGVGVIYQSDMLRPAPPTATAALAQAAGSPSFDRYIVDMGWMVPLYAPVRRSMESAAYADDRRRLALNLARLRSIPVGLSKRYVIVDAASSQLWMYENDRVVDQMRVVVGKPSEQTPMMAGFFRSVIVNPYWNVPEDLVRSRIAVNALAHGTAYLRESGYQVLSDWTDGASLVSADKVDWAAVAAGSQTVRVRQLPGPRNFMGRAKFMFPNEIGIYLHDTPDKELMRGDDRHLSSGCVRLEDAARFGRWLMKKPLPRRVRAPEQVINVPQLVPVYITYLTTRVEAGGLVSVADIYGLDQAGDGRKNQRLAANPS